MFLGTLLTLWTVLCAPAEAQVAPDNAWRTVETPHVRVTYPAGLDSLGRHAAGAAEGAWLGLAERLGPAPRGKVEVLVSDDTDFTNAFASVTPYPRVVVYAHPPAGDLDVLDVTDWFEVVIAHEMAHVFHLDEARGLSAALRSVFGRVPAGWPFFPHVTTPPWTIEGLAVRYETALTGSGRLAATATETAVRTAAIEDELPDLGFVTGDPVRWPGGSTRYVFGGEFLGWLAARSDEAAFERYVRSLAGDPLPLRVGRASERGFGVDFADAWETWRAETAARYRALADSLGRVAPLTRTERLTRGGHWALYPSWSPDGAALAVVLYDGRRDVRLARIDPASGVETSSTRVTRLGVPAWRDGGELVIGGLRWQGPHRLWDDLWLVPPEGPARPWTDGARLGQPDARRGGEVVAVESRGGSNRLVVVSAAGGEPLPVTAFEPGTLWAFPRWSPDGERIAVSRWRGEGYDVVVLDREGRVLREVAADGSVNLAPAWSPDGRWLVFGSDRTGIANLYAAPADSGGAPRQVTHVLGGAFFPDVSPDGGAIAFASYHHDGWAIERLPFDPGAWLDPLPAPDRPPRSGGPAGPPRRDTVEVSAPRPYSPWATLRPRYWIPVLEAGEEVRGQTILGPRLGLATSGFDVVGRHAYATAVTVDTEHGRPEGLLLVQDSRLGSPTLEVAAAQEFEFAGFALPAESAGDTLLVLERGRELALFGTWSFRRPWRSGALSVGAGLIEERLLLLERDLSESERFELDDPTTLLPLGVAQARLSTARFFDFSVSPENGVVGSARGEWRFDPEDRGRARREGTAQLAAYLALGRPWGFGRTVAAVRGSGGVVKGPGAGDGHFALGGASGEGLDVPLLEAFGEGRFLFPVRGYERGVRRGRAAWSASAEVRFPLALLQRGRGLWPVFLDRLSGAAFVDAGDAWDPCREGPAPCSESLDPLASAGGELLLDLTVLYRAPLTLRLGAARAFTEPKGGALYLRLGRSF